jgi:hypothetical protein
MGLKRRLGASRAQATAHQADFIQFVAVNALISVMPATSMLREARHVEGEVAAANNSENTG